MLTPKCDRCTLVVFMRERVRVLEMICVINIKENDCVFSESLCSVSSCWETITNSEYVWRMKMIECLMIHETWM